jgi:hypothetical protein
VFNSNQKEIASVENTELQNSIDDSTYRFICAMYLTSHGLVKLPFHIMAESATEIQTLFIDHGNFDDDATVTTTIFEHKSTMKTKTVKKTIIISDH